MMLALVPVEVQKAAVPLIEGMEPGTEFSLVKHCRELLGEDKPGCII